MSGEKQSGLATIRLPDLPDLFGHPIRMEAKKRAQIAGVLAAQLPHVPVTGVTHELGSYTEQAWGMLNDEQRGKLANAIHAAALRQANEGSSVVRRMLEEAIERLAKEWIEFHLPTMKEQVEAECNKRWEARVDAIVQQRLDAAITKIRAEFSK